MRVLHTNETLQVSGAQDETFNGFLIGSVAGFFIGSFAGLKLITKYPVIAISSHTMENTLKAAVIGGTVIGGVIGTMVGVILEDEQTLF